MLIYDSEIVKAIPDKNAPPVTGIEYCAGWHDHANMGISVIGAYDYWEQRYRVFCQDNLSEFQKLVDDHDLVISFNGLAFDNKLCAANGVKVSDEKTYDLLVEIWRAVGLGPTFERQTHGGFGLNALTQLNFGIGKVGTGAFAPVLWQQGKYGEVIDYCLDDVMLTKALLDKVMHYGVLTLPNNDYPVVIRKPGQWSK